MHARGAAVLCVLAVLAAAAVVDGQNYMRLPLKAPCYTGERGGVITSVLGSVGMRLRALHGAAACAMRGVSLASLACARGVRMAF
jgi:hypothetical protein